MFKKFALALAFSALTVFFVGCGDKEWVEFEPQNEMDKLALEVFKKEFPDKVAHRMIVIFKNGDLSDYTIDKVSGYQGLKRYEYDVYKFKIKDEKLTRGRSVEISCYEDKKECKVDRIKDLIDNR